MLLHIIGDAANNVGVIVAGALMWKLQWDARWYADPIVSMVIAFIIMASSVPLLRRTGRILLQMAPLGTELSAIQRELETVSACNGGALDKGA